MSRVLPILFNTDMVRAILDGHKTVTRRVVKPQPDWVDCGIHGDRNTPMKAVEPASADWEIKPPYWPGDILYVRETIWQKTVHSLDINGETKGYFLSDYHYTATETAPAYGWNYSWVKRPSIHMPKAAARIWLKVTDVRVERLQEISEEQIVREGINPPHYHGYRMALYGIWVEKLRMHIENENPHYVFSRLWNSTIKRSNLASYGWEANPWVWVIEFERCEKPEDARTKLFQSVNGLRIL